MNPMDNVKPSNILLVSQYEVVFTFSLDRYPGLSNPTLLKTCMDNYMHRYSPRVRSWRGTRTNDTLMIWVIGEIDSDILTHER